MVVDIHTHTFPEKIAGRALQKLSTSSHLAFHTNGTLDGLKSSMKSNGINISVIQPVATNPSQTEGINELACKINETTNETGLISFGGIHPENENYKEILTAMSQNGIKGVKLHPVFQGADIDDIRFKRIIDKASELGLIVLTHAGFDVGFPGNTAVTVEKISRLLEDVKPDKFILAHMAGWGEWEKVPEMLSKNKVYIDTSFSIAGMVYLDEEAVVWKPSQRAINEALAKEIFNIVGTDHILFGSDSPWSDQKKALEGLKKFFNEKDFIKVSGQNALDILKVRI